MPGKQNAKDGAAWVVERLEPRSLLSDAPFPALTDLENPDHTVVRVETTLGDIDLEMFNGDAPIAVARLLSNIRRGDIDPSFFHRLDAGRTLEAARFRADEEAGVREVPSATPLDIEAARSNVERTIAVARIPGTGANRFIFNLTDNSAELDGQATVLGRVVGDASWRVVQRIAGLQTADLDVALTGAEGDTFDAVPVIITEGSGHPGDGMGHDHHHQGGSAGGHDHDDPSVSIVRIVDAEVIKAALADRFYTNTIAYAEGFSGSTVDEFVPISNPNDFPVLYQVILRFERDPANPFSRRDAVVDIGVIAPHARGGVDVWHGERDFPGLPDSLVTPGRPYSIEIRSTGQLAATLSHYDFGVATGESLGGFPDTNWVIPGGQKGDGNFDFLVWFNANGTDATVLVTLVPEGQAPLEPILVTTRAHRRGGLNVSLLDQLPEGRFAARIMSNQPLFAGLSHYSPGEAPQGYVVLAAGGSPTTEGIVPLASFGPTADDTITMSFMTGGQEDTDGRITICHVPPGNPDICHTIRIGISALRAHLAHGDSIGPCGEECDHPGNEHGQPNIGDDPDEQPAVIDLRVDFEDPALADITLPGALTLQPGHSGSVRLDGSVLDINAYLGQRFSLHWSSSRPVFAGMAQTDAFDGVAAVVAVGAANTYTFGEGFMDPARAGTEVFETIAVYNPGTLAANVSIRIRYTDGFEVTVDRTADAGGTLFVDLHELDEVRTQGLENQRYFYSVQITADQLVVAQMTHLDTNLGRAGNAAGGFSTLGLPLGDLTLLQDL